MVSTEISQLDKFLNSLNLLDLNNGQNPLGGPQGPPPPLPGAAGGQAGANGGAAPPPALDAAQIAAIVAAVAANGQQQQQQAVAAPPQNVPPPPPETATMPPGGVPGEQPGFGRWYYTRDEGCMYRLCSFFLNFLAFLTFNY